MIIRLRTRCGCERYLDISDRYPPDRVHIPIVQDVNVMQDRSEMEIIVPRRRTFEFYGMHDKKIPLYREVLE